MNVFLEVRLGLGDVMACNFHRRHSAFDLSRMLAGFRSGQFDRIGIVPDLSQYWNEASQELFDALGIQIRTREDVKGWTDARQIPHSSEAEPSITPLPTRQPKLAIPRRYVLFSQLAARPDRCLSDPAISAFIASAGLPVIKVGRTMRQHRRFNLLDIPCDLDLTDMTTVPETAWLAQHAACVVAPLTFHRNWTWAFGVPVIEVAQEDRIQLLGGETLERTNREYAEGQYGMGPLNHWLSWPVHHDELAKLLDVHCDSRRKTFEQVAGKPALPPHVHFRPGTLDRETWIEVYRDNAYQLPPDMAGRTVVDIGANTGAFAVACLERGAAKVVAYEASPQNMAALEANLRPYGDRAIAHGLAVWRSDGVGDPLRQGEFPIVNTGAANVLSETGRELPSVPFDAVAREVGQIDLLKLDCEGSEFPILLTATELSRVKRIVGEFHQGVVDMLRRGTKWQTLAAHLSSLGFEVHASDPAARTGLFWASRP